MFLYHSQRNSLDNGIDVFQALFCRRLDFLKLFSDDTFEYSIGEKTRKEKKNEARVLWLLDSFYTARIAVVTAINKKKKKCIQDTHFTKVFFTGVLQKLCTIQYSNNTIQYNAIRYN